MPPVSAQQLNILRWLLKLTLHAEQHQPELLRRGFPWRLQSKGKALENSQRASYSRALARLSRRGLVVLIKGPEGVRTTRVLLTAEGRRLAEALCGY